MTTAFDPLIASLAILFSALAGALVLRRAPRGAVVLVAVTIAFVPIWVGLQAVVFWPAATLACVVVVVTLLGRNSWGPIAITDLLLVAVTLLVATEFAFGMIRISALFTLGATWGLAYLAGRMLGHGLDAHWIHSTLAVVLGVAAVLAVVESLTQVNVFTLIPGDADLRLSWATLQYRGGHLRVEGAFGHSIALSCSMAIGIAMALGSRLPSALKLVLVAVMGLAAVLSFSRLGMLTCGLTGLCMLIGNREANTRRFRRRLFAIGVVSAAIAGVAVQTIFRASGTEASNSANYRTLLLGLVRDVSLVGTSPALSTSSSGTVSVGGFGSIDNAALLFALTYGWLPLLLLVPLVVGLLLRAGQRRLSPAAAALVGQLPAFVTVALITQYAILLWLIAGLAVSVSAAHRRSASPEALGQLAPPLLSASNRSILWPALTSKDVHR